MHAQRIRHIAQIRGDGHFHAPGRKRKADRISRIVGNCETGHVEIADREAATGLKYLQRRRTLAPIDKLRSSARQIHRQQPLRGFDQGYKAAGVIAMLVRDQNGVQTGYIFANRGQPLGNFSAAQTGIDQNSSTLRCDKRRIASARGRENADLDDFLLRLPVLIGYSRSFRRC